MASNKKSRNATVSNKKHSKQGYAKHNKKRKKNRRLYYILLAFLAIATIIILSLTVFFKIDTIAVKGNNFYRDQEIIDVINIEKETNLFLAKVSLLPELIEKQFPYLEQVTVHKILPSTIEVRVVPSEVSMILEIQKDEEYALVSKTGKILETGIPQLPPDIIIVKNFDIGGKLPGEYIGEYEKEKIEKDDSDSLKSLKKEKNIEKEEVARNEEEFLRFVEYLENAIETTEFKKITNLDFANPYNVTAIYENRITIELGTEIELEFKLRYIEEALKELPKDEKGTLSVENVMLKSEAIFTPYEEPEIEEKPKGKPKGEEIGIDEKPSTEKKEQEEITQPE